MISGWWCTYTPMKNMTSSIGMMTFPTQWKNQNCSSHHKPDLTNHLHARHRDLIETSCFEKWQITTWPKWPTWPTWHGFHWLKIFGDVLIKNWGDLPFRKWDKLHGLMVAAPNPIEIKLESSPGPFLTLGCCSLYPMKLFLQSIDRHIFSTFSQYLLLCRHMLCTNSSSEK